MNESLSSLPAWGIFAYLMVKGCTELVKAARIKINGRAEIKAGAVSDEEFNRHVCAVEKMFNDDPPRLHTELLTKTCESLERLETGQSETNRLLRRIAD